MEIVHNAPKNVLKLSGKLHISSADELRQVLANCLTGQEELILDLSQVEACDTPSLQLLLSARQTASLLRKRFRLTAVSSTITGADQALGLSLLEPTGSLSS